MISIGGRSRRARGPRERAVRILAAVIAILTALSTTLLRTTRGVRHVWFADAAPWFPWALGGILAVLVIGLMVLVVARSRDGVVLHAEPEARNDDGHGDSDDNVRRKRMVVLLVVLALLTGLMAATIGLIR